MAKLQAAQTNEIKIEKGIAIPPRKSGGIFATLRSMDVGDSITLPKGRSSSLGGYAKTIGIKLTMRSIDDDTIRVWRVA